MRATHILQNYLAILNEILNEMPLAKYYIYKRILRAFFRVKSSCFLVLIYKPRKKEKLAFRK
jgi:hypothetical protein